MWRLIGECKLKQHGFICILLLLSQVKILTVYVSCEMEWVRLEIIFSFLFFTWVLIPLFPHINVDSQVLI